MFDIYLTAGMHLCHHLFQQKVYYIYGMIFIIPMPVSAWNFQSEEAAWQTKSARSFRRATN